MVSHLAESLTSLGWLASILIDLVPMNICTMSLSRTANSRFLRPTPRWSLPIKSWWSRVRIYSIMGTSKLCRGPIVKVIWALQCKCNHHRTTYRHLRRKPTTREIDLSISADLRMEMTTYLRSLILKSSCLKLTKIKTHLRMSTTRMKTTNKRMKKTGLSRRSKIERHILLYFKTKYSTFRMKNYWMRSMIATKTSSILKSTPPCRGVLIAQEQVNIRQIQMKFTVELLLIPPHPKDLSWVRISMMRTYHLLTQGILSSNLSLIPKMKMEKIHLIIIARNLKRISISTKMNQTSWIFKLETSF